MTPEVSDTVDKQMCMKTVNGHTMMYLINQYTGLRLYIQ